MFGDRQIKKTIFKTILVNSIFFNIQSGELQELEVITKQIQPGYLQCLLDVNTFNAKRSGKGKTEFAVYNTFNDGKMEMKSNLLKIVVYNGTCLDCQESSCKTKVRFENVFFGECIPNSLFIV